MGARYYDPSTAKFLSQDTAFLAMGDRVALSTSAKVSQEAYLANPQHLSSYSYAFNNPMTYRDPNGNFAMLAPLAVLYAPQIIAGVGMAASLIGASIASWQWGSGVGYMMEVNHTAANASFDASIGTSAMSGTLGAGLIMQGMSMTESASATQSATQSTSAKGGTYKLTSPATGDVMRAGRTNDLIRREGEHFRDPALSDLKFSPVHRTNNYAEQRGLEQMLHRQYNPPLNKIAPISPSKPNLSDYMKAAENFVKGL